MPSAWRRWWDDLRFEAGQLPAMPKLFVLRDEAFGLLTLHASDDVALEAAVLQNLAAPQPRPPAAGGPGSRQRAAACAEEQRLTGLLLVVAALALGVAAMGTHALMTDTCAAAAARSCCGACTVRRAGRLRWHCCASSCPAGRRGRWRCRWRPGLALPGRLPTARRCCPGWRCRCWPRWR